MTDQLASLESALATRYRIERELGAGGMATVYLALDLKHNRNVAVKVLRPELAAIVGASRFLKEIEVTANLQHPNILPLYDSGEADSFLYYVMPYIEGETLRDLLAREKQLGIEETVTIVRSVAAALQYAHERKVVHRDIKPANVLLSGGQALVADFGIALAISQAGGTRLTETGLSIGTPHYMSPEQAMGDRAVDGRSDVYSLGCMAYEMLAGDPPHTGSTAQAVIAKILTEDPPSVRGARPTTPDHVAAAVHKALARLPADRFSSAAQFSDALTRGSTTASLMTAPVAATPKARPWRPVVAAAVLGIAVGVGATVMTRPAPGPGPLGRFGIQVEPTTSIGSGFAQLVALSPDGNTLAFVGRGPRGFQLFVRSLADSVPRPLTGTDGGFAPFFSPDGREIGFWSPQRLQRVPAEGGAPTLIADSAGPFATWTPNGDVVFIDPVGRALRIVAADGSRREIARSDTAFFLAVSPLPDGNAVLAARLAAGRNQSRIVAVSLSDGVMSDVGLPDVVMAKYISSGHVVYQRRLGGPLMAAPFDAKRRRVTGDGVAVAPDGRITFRVVAQWDAAPNAIAYVPPSPQELVLVDRDGRVTVVQDQPRAYHHPRFAPDGRRVALDITDADSRDLWIVHLSDRRMSRLTVGETANDPYWSPDGRQLAYTAAPGSARSVFMRNADGSGTRDSVFGNENDYSSGTWFPDGRMLVVSSALSAGLWAIPLGNTDEAARVAGSRPTEAYPAFSRDGRWLAYVSAETGRQEVYVRPFPEPGGRIQVSVNGGSEPVWSADGREMFYREDAGPSSRMIAAQVRTSPTFEVVDRVPLFDVSHYVSAEDHANYDVHPNGRSFVMIRSSQATQIQLILNWTRQMNDR